MLKFRMSAKTLTTALGLAWATTASAQSLPSPAAPATISRLAAVAPQPRSAAPSSSAGVISADHLFSDGQVGEVTQTGHRRAAQQCQPCQVYECPPTYSYCEPCSSGFGDCLFNADADAFDLSDSFWDALGYESTLDFGGWMQFGYHNHSDGVFNTRPHDLQAQQINLYVEQVADGSEGFGIGGRIDMMYGTDAPNTQSFGNHPGRWDYDPAQSNYWSNRGGAGATSTSYGWAIPQAYVELATGDLSVKVGHFYTLLGYQVVPATGNFFYSIPYTFNFSEAFTHTGALATYKASDDVTVYAGWTAGWDTGYDQLFGGNAFLGGTSLALTDDMTLTYIATAGNLGWIGRGYTHSIVLDYNINEDWEYVFQSDLVSVENSPGNTVNPINGGANTDFDSIGINQYLFYKITDGVRAGGRMEWYKADGTSYYEAALGLNIRPLPNILVRPEVRHNWSPSDSVIGTPYGDQTIGAVDVIFTF
ncbi:MAG: outer membrane beta-barrel protein [Planctomycetaceae bacterium]